MITVKDLDLLVLGHTALDYIMQVEEFSKKNTSSIIEKMETLMVVLLIMWQLLLVIVD